MNQRWDERFMAVAREVATWSKDQSTKVGCVVASPDRDIKATGYNGFPRNVDDSISERHERPAKYSWTEHAERNAIFAAARLGTSLVGCTLYTTLFPCVDCARAVIQSGVVRLVAPAPNYDDQKWGKDFTLATEMLKEAGVVVDHFIDYKKWQENYLALAEEWFCGKPWAPGAIYTTTKVDDSTRNATGYYLNSKVQFDGEKLKIVDESEPIFHGRLMGYSTVFGGQKTLIKIP